MYELIFWQYDEEIYLNHHEVYEALSENENVDGLRLLQTTVILNRISKVFSDWQQVDQNSWQNPKNSEAFQIKTTAQSVKIDCYGTNGKTMDLLVSILDEFNCPLYDPQVPARYDEFFE
jgi:hypothetical protein